MKIGLMAVAILVLVGVIATMQPGLAQSQDTDAEATIAALQTQVSQLQTQVAGTMPTAPATAVPRPTVATQPQMLTNEWELLYYYAIEDDSSTTLLGEVRNTTGQRLGSPYLEITLLDAEGNIVGVTNGSPALVTTDPGEATPFEATFSDIRRDEWYQAHIAACEWGSKYYVEEGYGELPALQLQSVEEAEKSADRLEIEGKVFNSGSTPVEQVQVTALVYLPDGRYAGHATARIDVPIPAGKTARFNLEGWGYNVPALELPETGDNYSYRLVVGTEPGARVYGC